jgi:hypothetical protein
LRSICAGALLATCGLMVPARQASVPRFDAIILRMMSTDSPADGKSAFQMVRAQYCKHPHLWFVDFFCLFVANHLSCLIVFVIDV